MLREQGLAQLPPILHVLGKWHHVDEMGVGTGPWLCPVHFPPGLSHWRRLLQWHICPPGGTHSLALFLFLLMDNFTLWSSLGRNTWLGLPNSCTISCVVMFWGSISSVQLQFILFLWDLGKGLCKGIAIIIWLGSVIFITYTAPLPPQLL